ncbi:hypothetical protein [Burkholderia sp. WAC0059]|uniref:hypothetical protein n=1 Tax=Burkholderia sp. WAC0059 TaxID=2066022 RepID=UPI0011AF3C3B|nr:hypothetical protein [Burkholderia sp. WAC0059]
MNHSFDGAFDERRESMNFSGMISESIDDSFMVRYTRAFRSELFVKSVNPQKGTGFRADRISP